MMRAGLLLTLLAALVLLAWFRSAPVHTPARVATAIVESPPTPQTRDAVDAADSIRGGDGRGAGDAALPAEKTDTVAADRASPSLLDFAMAAMHAAQAGQPCLAGTANTAKAEKVAIHRWVDEAGIVHFSDQAPIGPASGHRRIEVDGQPAVIVNARGFDVNLPDFLAQRAVADTLAIERALHSSLGVDGEPGLVLNVEFIGDEAAYLRRVGSPLMAGTDGTYSSADRTIHIRLQADAASNFLILRHEITHALIHERVGSLPTALNEGMAGFFEQMEVSGLGAQIAIEESAASLREAAVSTDGREELVDLLARDGTLFYAAGREQRYLRAFALIAVLMGRPDGREALAAVLAAQRDDPCRPVEAGAILDARYPGGLAGLAADWARWLRDPPRSVQAF